MRRLQLPSPDRWKIVSTAALSEKDARRFLGLLGEDIDVVVLEPRTMAAAVIAVADADIVIGDFRFEIPLTRAVIEAMTRCRLIQQPSAEFDHIDLGEATAQGITVANVAGANDMAVAEHTVAVAVALMRELLLADREVRQGHWPQDTRVHYELAGKTWGIVGLGRVGKQVAKRLAGWDVDTIYYDKFRPGADVEEEFGVSYADLEDLLGHADVVSLHLPYSEDTHHLIDAGLLNLMQPSSYLINVAHGAIVDERALIHALHDGTIRGAALDVFEHEPLPRKHPLSALDNVILTPHVAGTARKARVRLLKMTAANVQRVMRGEQPIDVVNGVQ